MKLNLYSFSKTKPSLIWGKKIYKAFKNKNKKSTVFFFFSKFLSLFLYIIFPTKPPSCNENHPSIPISHKLLY